MMRFILSLCLYLLLVSQAFAQSIDAADTLAPYQKNTDLPSFTIQLLDSTTIFNTQSIVKGKPTVFVLFSPDCDHCAQLAQEIKTDVQQFDQINLFMISPPMPLSDIKMFAHINGLVDKKQIVIGQDRDFFFGSFFRAETVPFIVIYDAEKKLFSTLKRLRKLEELTIALSQLNEKNKP